MTSQSDTEALKALVAEIRLRFTSGNSIPVHDVRLNVDEWALLERMLASQTQDMVLVPREPNPDAAPKFQSFYDWAKSYSAIGKLPMEIARDAFEAAAAPVASQMGEPDVALNEEARVILKIMVEALMYGEAALNAAQTKMTQTGDLKGAGLMQPALDKIRSALKAEKTAAPAAGMGAEKMADEYSALIGERGYTGGLPREEFIEFLRRHMQQGK